MNKSLFWHVKKKQHFATSLAKIKLKRFVCEAGKTTKLSVFRQNEN
jgi:hypothetical protein|tara:strand:+ start:81 stop:218 length:138 start_codon:yes stop_codon:yes gene_type:complete